MCGYGTLVLGRPVLHRPVPHLQTRNQRNRQRGGETTNRSLLALLDFTLEEIHFLLDLAASLKQAKHDGTETPRPTF